MSMLGEQLLMAEFGLSYLWEMPIKQCDTFLSQLTLDQAVKQLPANFFLLP
jgi:hypothetical protein